MFQIKTLSKDDYSFAVELANTMNWNMAPEDFEFMAALEPFGCFLLLDGSERLGIATCISYGKVGWFGNLIVKGEHRKKGAGSALVNHAMDYLHAKGVETVGLYAYPNLVGFYGNLGFKLDCDFSVLTAKNLAPVATAEVLPAVDKQMFSAIVKFDSGCFGAERKRLLESIILEPGNASYYVSEGKEVLGYVAATIYESMAWVGPLICQSAHPEVAVSLVKAVLAKVGGKNVYAAVSKADVALLEVFSSFGFAEEFFVSGMFLGKASAKNCIYLAESLERG